MFNGITDLLWYNYRHWDIVRTLDFPRLHVVIQHLQSERILDAAPAWP
jgi:hypothetical protein